MEYKSEASLLGYFRSKPPRALQESWTKYTIDLWL